MENSILNILIKAKDEASAVIKDVGKNLEESKKNVVDWGKAFTVAGGMLSGAGLIGVSMIKDWVQASSEAQTSMIKVNTLIGQLADVVPGSFTQIQQAVEKTSKAFIQLGFDDEETAMAMTKLLGTTKDLTKAQEYMALAADIARYKNIGIAEASDIVNKALLGNTKIFKQYGLEVSKGTKPVELLASLQERLSGQAENYANSYAGAMDKLSVTTSNIKETLGETFLPIIADLADKFATLLDNINNLNPDLLKTIAIVVGVGTAFAVIFGPILLLIGMLPALASGFALLTSGAILPAIGIILALAGVVALGYLAFKNWENIKPILENLWITISTFFFNIWNTLSTFFMNAWNSIMSFLIPVWNFISAVFTAIWNFISYILNNLFALFTFIFGSIWALIQIIFTLIDAFFKTIWNGISDFVDKNLSGIFKTFSNIFNNIKNTIQTIFGSVYNWFVDKLDKFWDKVTDITDKVWGAFKKMADGISSALKSIKFPHLSIGEGSITIMGKEIKYPKLNVDWYQEGGWVRRTGLAMVHAGEYVLSKDMLEGRKPIGAPVYNYSNSYSPVVNAIINTPIDLDYLAYKLSWQLRNG